MRLRMIGPILLFVCALLWGSAFVAQKVCTGTLGPFAVLFARSALAALFLYVWTRLGRGRGFTRMAWFGGTLMGVFLFVAQLAQQVGIMYTTPGISSFLTSNYILLVPIVGIFFGKWTGVSTWIGVIVALTGSFLICVDPHATGFVIGKGELLTLLCAFLFALQILAVDRYAPQTDPIAFSCVSQIATMVFALPFLFTPSESVHFTRASFVAAIGPILYLGFVSSGVAYTLQILGQVRTPPTLASILMSLESVFGAVAGYLWYGDVLSPRQLVGCALVFLAATVTPLVQKRQV